MSISLALAFILDFFIGDPQWLWHPVCGIGFLISRGEKIIRKIIPNNNKGEAIGGTVLFFAVCLISFLLPFGILYVLYIIEPWLCYAANIFFSMQILAANCLKKESMKVYTALDENNLTQARVNISYLVGRDTENLNEEAVIKAAVETVAENTTDGVTAPMLYIIIGGAPLGFLYKAVNTLDSMVGYKNNKYMYFGRFSAKADDAFNFIPSRITAVFMLLASLILRLNYKNAVKIFFRDRNKHSSPNAGQTESVAAGALETELGGDSYYFSRLYKKAKLGDKIREIKKADIITINKIMYLTSFLCLLFFIALRTAAEVILCTI